MLMSIISCIDLYSTTHPGAWYRVLFNSVSVLFLSLIMLPHIVFSFQSALVFLEEDCVNFHIEAHFIQDLCPGWISSSGRQYIVVKHLVLDSYV